MIIIAALLIGAAWGTWIARKRGGNTYDILQYAAGFAIAFTIVGVFATVAIDRLL